MSTGCTTHQCDSDCVAIGGTAPADLPIACPTDTTHYDGGGPSDVSHGLNSITWESAPFYGHWLDFPGQRQYLLYWPDEVTGFYAASRGVGNQILVVQPYIAIGQDNPGWNGTIVGTGQLAEWGPLFDGNGNLAGIEISNQSCAEYFLRVVVTITVADPGFPAPPADAGGP